MTNFEKYREEILEMAKNGHNIAVNNKTQALVECADISCGGLPFRKNHCQTVEPAPTLTVKERGFCEIVEHGHIARDKDGSLYFYLIRPFKDDEDDDEWNNAYGEYYNLNSKAFTFITWKSNKAWSIEELLQLEVEE